MEITKIQIHADLSAKFYLHIWLYPTSTSTSTLFVYWMKPVLQQSKVHFLNI